MINTTIEILSLAASLGALLGTAVIVDWRRIRAWWVTLEDDERLIVAQDEAEYLAAAMEMQEPHEAAHPIDVERYDITRPMPLPEPWDLAKGA